MSKFYAVLTSAAVYAAALMPAHAADTSTFLGGIEIGKNADRYEVRVGGGIYDTGPFTPDTFDGGVINGEILAPSPDFLAAIGSPRPYLGTDIAISDDPIHVFYAGLNWEAYLTERFYLGFSLGGSVNTDEEKRNDEGDLRDLGSPVLFHLQASAGFDFTRDVGVQVFLNHISNANLASSNDGLESTGARLIYRF
jgi:lipid A 3-O-deacylase